MMVFLRLCLLPLFLRGFAGVGGWGGEEISLLSYHVIKENLSQTNQMGALHMYCFWLKCITRGS